MFGELRKGLFIQTLMLPEIRVHCIPTIRVLKLAFQEKKAKTREIFSHTIMKWAYDSVLSLHCLLSALWKNY